MTLKLVPFKRQHLAALDEDGLAQGLSALLPQEATDFAELHNSWTIMRDDTPLACGGTIPFWPGRYMAWAGVSDKAGPHMRKITRLARWVVTRSPGRVEITVREDFQAGHRWARMLGFQVENPPGRLEAYGPEGENHIAYVLINR